MLLINRTGILQELHLPYWGWQLPPLHWLSAWLSSSLCCIKISLLESSACKRLQRQDAEVCQVITVTALSASFSHTFQDTYNVEMLKNCRMKASVFLNYFAFLPKCHKSMYTAAFIYFKIYFLAKSALLCSEENGLGGKFSPLSLHYFTSQQHTGMLIKDTGKLQLRFPVCIFKQHTFHGVLKLWIDKP